MRTKKSATHGIEKRKPDDPEQSKRFIEAAREIGADETEKAADRAFEQLTKQPKKSRD
jgi:hypothetical protein